MAETVVSSLIDRLVPLLTQEAKLLRGIHGEVADIKDEPESIQSFLKDADARAEAPSNMSHRGSPVRKETSLYFSPSLPESIFPSAMSPSDSESPLFFPVNMSPKFSHSNSIELIFPPARSETTGSSQNDEEIIQKPFISSFSHLFPPGTMSDSDSANSVCDYGPTTHSISLLFPANESDTEAETETGSLAFNGTTPNLSHSIMQLFPPARSPSQTDSSKNYVINRTDFDGCVFNGTPPAHSPRSSLIVRLFPLLTKEAKLLGGIHGEVADIKDELESVRSFLKDADARAAAERDASEGVKTWVKQVQEVAFRIDVAIDRYLLYVAPHDPHWRGFTGFVHKTAHLLKTLIPRRKMASEIQEIKASVQKIKERSDRYHFKYIDQASSSNAPKARWYDPRNNSLNLDDFDIVGIEFPRDRLIGWLVKGPPHRIVLSVVGMGGLGKTTLVKKVYDHQIVRGHFDCHAWISLSRSYNIEDLLRSMIKQFCEVKNETPPMGVDSMDGVSLIKNLRDYLQQKRYVVVLDDVWKIDFWEDIKHALLDNSKGCRIMITTRNWKVINFCKKSSHVFVHQLQPLPPEKAWELFCKRAFLFDFGEQCPIELEKLSHEIVKKCHGLPLAITAIGGLLSTKNKTLFEWRNLHDNLGFELGRIPHLSSVNKVLSLSFEDLPYHLKSCLLYFGMYPVSFAILCRILIRQWIAEGFVNKINDKALEDIGQEYLIELINRSLVQVLEIDSGGEVIHCRIHDLLHEIILQKMEDLSFCHVLSKKESRFEGRTRRVSVNRASLGVLEQFKKSHIHSLLFFNINEFPISFMSKFLQNFKLVKVLDFNNTPLDHLPEEVGNLFHLRYLNLNNTEVKTLPNSIGKLQNLEILLMWRTAIREIPVTINMLHKLRCLVVCYFDAKMDMSLNILRGVKLHWSIGCLKALTELQYVDANYGGVKLIEELGKLSQLRLLGLVNLTRETGRALCVSIKNMNCLKYLFVSSINEDEVIDLQPISSPPKCLQFLSIKGRLTKLPDWISELQHLVSLKIYWTRLSDDPLNAFQNLPNLAELLLGMKAYNGEQLHIGKGGFPKLKELWLVDLSELNSLNIEKEAFPLLEKLHIADCSQLKEVPSGFQHLRNLKELNIAGMPTEFEKSLDPEQGSHYWIVQHVPSIFLHHKVRKGFYGHESRNLLSEDLERSRGQTINQDDDIKNDISGDDISASVEKGKQAIST